MTNLHWLEAGIFLAVGGFCVIFAAHLWTTQRGSYMSMKTIQLGRGGKSAGSQPREYTIEHELTPDEVRRIMYALRKADPVLHDRLVEPAYQGFERPRPWTIQFKI